MFKRTLVLLLLSAAAAAAPGAETMQFPGPDAVVQYLSTKLGLSADQADAIKPVVTERQQKLRALLADTSAGSMQRRRDLLQIMQDSDAKINAVLNADQQKTYAELEAQMRDQMKQRMQAK